jgi:hypothetical protein
VITLFDLWYDGFSKAWEPHGITEAKVSENLE